MALVAWDLGELAALDDRAEPEELVEEGGYMARRGAPALRLLTGPSFVPGQLEPETFDPGRPGPGEGRQCRRHEARPLSRQAQRPGVALRTDSPTVDRARRRLEARRRRLGAAAVLFVLTVLVLLALPLRVLAGTSALPKSGSAGHEVVYVVRPGDTLASIAARFERPGDRGRLLAQLLAEAGSSTVVPGEHLVLPG